MYTYGPNIRAAGRVIENRKAGARERRGNLTAANLWDCACVHERTYPALAVWRLVTRGIRIMTAADVLNPTWIRNPLKEEVLRFPLPTQKYYVC